ncbi:hypothetical protein ACTSKR_00500 [Chitinibacteraceae bacterium HSL-7]
MLRHSPAYRPAWWMTLAVLAFAAWFGLPLLSGASFTHGFFGVFWYTMLALAFATWAVTPEQAFEDGRLLRRWRLLGVWTLREYAYDLAQFDAIALEQEPAPFGRDHVWLVFTGKERLVFGHWRASNASVVEAVALAEGLSAATGLPYPPPAAAEASVEGAAVGEHGNDQHH